MQCPWLRWLGWMLFVPGVTILLSLSVFSLMIAECLPQTSEAIPLLGQVARPLVSVLVPLQKKIKVLISFSQTSSTFQWKLSRRLCVGFDNHRRIAGSNFGCDAFSGSCRHCSKRSVYSSNIYQPNRFLNLGKLFALKKSASCAESRETWTTLEL